jgi:hypothetical protein
LVYQGTTLEFRAVAAYWPRYDLAITGATNSQPRIARTNLHKRPSAASS